MDINSEQHRRATKRPGSMLTSGDVVELDLGQPERHEAGFVHPAVIVPAQRILDATPTVVQVVPLTSTVRGFHSEIVIEPESNNGLDVASAAQFAARYQSVGA